MIRQSVSSGVSGSIPALFFIALNDSATKRFLALTVFALAPISRASQRGSRMRSTHGAE
jgi:hypothetical protein